MPSTLRRLEDSTHYIAMIETCKTFPKPEMLDRLSLVMEIEPHDLFYMPPSAESALELLQKTVVANIENTVGKAIKQAFAEECKTQYQQVKKKESTN